MWQTLPLPSHRIHGKGSGGESGTWRGGTQRVMGRVVPRTPGHGFPAPLAAALPSCLTQHHSQCGAAGSRWGTPLPATPQQLWGSKPPNQHSPPKLCNRVQQRQGERPSGSPHSPTPAWWWQDISLLPPPDSRTCSIVLPRSPSDTHTEVLTPSISCPPPAHLPRCPLAAGRRVGGATRVLTPPLGKPDRKGQEKKKAPRGAFQGGEEDVRCAEGTRKRAKFGSPAPGKQPAWCGMAWRGVARRGMSLPPAPSPPPLR